MKPPHAAVFTARFSAMAFAALAALATALCSPPTQAQALNPSWEGDWVAVETSQGQPGARLRIAREAGATQPATYLTRDQTTGNRRCQLAYDDTITLQALRERIQALRDWQLNPEHWPGTDPSQLIGLAREFDRAQALVQAIGPGAYRRVRLKGPDCETADDVFLLLHRGQELVQLVFPEATLGLAVASFRRRR